MACAKTRYSGFQEVRDSMAMAKGQFETSTLPNELFTGQSADQRRRSTGLSGHS